MANYCKGTVDKLESMLEDSRMRKIAQMTIVFQGNVCTHKISPDMNVLLNQIF